MNKMNGCCGQINAFKKLVDLLMGGYFKGVETDGIGTPAKSLKGLLVCNYDVRILYILPDLPWIPFPLRSSQKRWHSGCGVKVFESLKIPGPVIGADIKSFRGFPDQFFGIIRTFQVGNDFRF